MENNTSKSGIKDYEKKPRFPVNKLTGILITLTTFLIILIVILGWLLHDRRQRVEEFEEVTYEKFELIRELENLSREYDDLMTDNVGLNQELEGRQEEIEKLIDELNRTRVANTATINQYRRELGTLRDVLKSYIVQVDSLNQANILLRAENLQVRQQAVMVETQLKEERQIKEDLSARVELGSRLMVENLAALPINSRGREINRVGRTDQVQVCFTLRRNAIAESGMRTVYIRITRPDNLVLASSAENLIMIDNDPVVFTASREINYENLDIDACIYYHDDGSLIPGTYKVTLYTEGYQIGSTEFSLR
jgi:uncharacterized coiled-coil protein SlyX